MNVLVTGGAGYIGSHTCVVLLEAGHEVTVIDNLSNGSEAALARVEELAGKSIRFLRGDVRNQADLAQAFNGGIDAVIHFAALKAVGESCQEPLRYYDNNISGTIAVLQTMQANGVRNLIFSSTATIYGDQLTMPVSETAALHVSNPYARSKLVMEQVIGDWCAAHSQVSVVLLRYFNPVGAHPSGRIGEDPCGTPNNLMPYIAQVAIGRRQHLQVFGNDYPTDDGTGVRDYLHVMDLADAHVSALTLATRTTGCEAIDLGTGRGTSVLQLVHAFEQATGQSIPLQIIERRSGDVAACWADPAKACERMGRRSTRTLGEMCADTWSWQKHNPEGYQG